ncbi:MAG: hypothetical protein H2184_15765 [Candidatus Galacturonibacter soehngenii]|nr:hypothetical protein [Candidatus Galacturonibacter soehngenii]
MKNHLKKEEFFEKVRSEVELNLKGHTVKLNRVTKQGDLVLNGLVIFDEFKETNVSPTIYLDDYYNKLTKGSMTTSSIVTDVVSIWKMNKNVKVDMNDLKDTSKMYLKVLNKDLSSEYLQDKLVKEIKNTNLVLVPYIEIPKFIKKNGTSTVTLTKKFIYSLGINEEEIFDIAMNNCKCNIKCVANSVIDTLTSFSKPSSINIPKEPGMVLITNDRILYGAAIIFFSDILKQIAELWENDLIIIPSSVHEVIVLPLTKDVEREELKNIIEEAISECVTVDEILDNVPYRYLREKDCIEIF